MRANGKTIREMGQVNSNSRINRKDILGIL
jgi:hypothetical protein